MEEVLDYTPELLPVLKEAGVVDSGGRGLVEIMKGVFDVMCGKEADYQLETVAAPAQTAQQPAEKRPVNTENISTADIKFGYCTEFIIILEKEFTIMMRPHLRHFSSRSVIRSYVLPMMKL